MTTNINSRLKWYVNLCFNPKYISNILSLKHLKKKYQVTYESAPEKYVVTHQPVKSYMMFAMHINVTDQ